MNQNWPFGANASFFIDSRSGITLLIRPIALTKPLELTVIIASHPRGQLRLITNSMR